MKKVRLFIVVLIILLIPTLSIANNFDGIDFCSAIIYKDQGTWHIAQGSGHNSHKIDSVSTWNGYIVLYFSTIDIKNILYFAVTNDETLPYQGIHAGASVNSGVAYIVLSQIINGVPQVIESIS